MPPFPPRDDAGVAHQEQGHVLGDGIGAEASLVLDSFIYGFALQERTLPVATPETLAEFGET